jgi:alpha-ketoglutarate-dependent taurine dioxygenase
MALSVERCDAPLGAVCTGVRFDRDLSEAEYADLVEALDEHLVLVLRGHPPIGNAELVRFARHFGELRPSLAAPSRLPDYPEINLVSHREIGPVKGTGGSGVLQWHSDLTFTPPSVVTGFLYAVSVPPAAAGGETTFTNLREAFERMPVEMKDKALHQRVRYRLRQDLGYIRADQATLESLPTIEHDLVQRTGPGAKPNIWPNVGIFDGDVEGMEQGPEYLRSLFDHATRPEFTYTHFWDEGDMVIWLNVATMHHRTAFDPERDRVMYHLNTAGHIP